MDAPVPIMRFDPADSLGREHLFPALPRWVNLDSPKPRQRPFLRGQGCSYAGMSQIDRGHVLAPISGSVRRDLAVAVAKSVGDQGWPRFSRGFLEGST